MIFCCVALCATNFKISVGSVMVVLASMWDTYDDKANFFWVNFGLLMFATLLMFALVKNLNKVMKENGIN